uniref:hypothetical protein n=1 Tax=Roseivirga sp. TaxID=1964215 RepID=UPI004048D120
MNYKSLLTILILLGTTLKVSAQSDYFFAEGARFDPKIPSPEKYLGYPIGTLHTRHDAIVGYMRELARLSDRAKLDTIGETYEQRQLVVLTITSPENHKNLESIRKEHLKLNDPNQKINDYTVYMNDTHYLSDGFVDTAKRVKLTKDTMQIKKHFEIIAIPN